MKNFIGCVAICQNGHMGIIESGDSNLWLGRKIFPPEDFGKPWQSKKPIVFLRAKKVSGGNEELSLQQYKNGDCLTTEEWVKELKEKYNKQNN